MTPHDLDRLERERFDVIFNRLHDGDEKYFENFFRSEKVSAEAFDEKIVLTSFSCEKIFSFLPFTRALYACICPMCVDKSNFDAFREFISRGLLVPIFQAPFRFYASEIVDLAIKYDSVSRAEYQAFRSINMPVEERFNLCSHCARKMFSSMEESIKSRRNREAYLRHIYAIQENAMPFLQFDKTLIDRAQTACANNRLSKLDELSKLSSAVGQLKTSLAFNTPLMIEKEDIELLPARLTDNIDEAKSELAALKADAAKSLDLIFTPNMPIAAYAELMQQYRPRICDTVEVVVKDCAAESREMLNREIIRLNSEIRSIRGSKRFNFMRASMDFVTKGDDLVKAAMIGTIIMPINSWLGCIGAGGFAAKKLRQLVTNNAEAATGSPHFKRLKRSIARDVQPYVDSISRLYLQCSPAAIRVISLQDAISARSQDEAA